MKIFLSTPSARRATTGGGCPTLRQTISIHALREEGDFSGHSRKHTSTYFYPRPPRGGRPGYRCVKHNADPFLSTPSARRATLAAGSA